jgi:ribonuclease HI
MTIFTGTQAAILRMTSDEPSPGRTYALKARKYIANLWQRGPAITIELRWCPADKGLLGNEEADEWAKMQRTSQLLMVWNFSVTATGM